MIASCQAPDSESLLTPVFLSSTCFQPSGAAQQQLGFLNFTYHPGPSESDVYSDVIQEAQSNDLLHTVRLLMCLHVDTPLHGNNARGTKYTVYYASVATHTVFENIKWLRSELCQIRNVAVPSLVYSLIMPLVLPRK